jgi:hypothetical protein
MSRLFFAFLLPDLALAISFRAEQLAAAFLAAATRRRRTTRLPLRPSLILREADSLLELSKDRATVSRRTLERARPRTRTFTPLESRAFWLVVSTLTRSFAFLDFFDFDAVALPSGAEPPTAADAVAAESDSAAIRTARNLENEPMSNLPRRLRLPVGRLHARVGSGIF